MIKPVFCDNCGQVLGNVDSNSFSKDEQLKKQALDHNCPKMKVYGPGQCPWES